MVKKLISKLLTAGIICVSCSLTCFAGDAAAFNDIGFSRDGKVYVFGQYGKTDQKFQPYAEIYTVDVEKNEYVPGEVYKTFEAQSSRSGRQVYEDLSAKHYLDLKKYDLRTVGIDDVLYILEDAKKKGTDAISFQNYGEESASSYDVQLVPTFTGKGKECRSQFYIDLKMKDDNGNVVKTYKVGSPDIKRKGVTGYKIVRIFRDASQKGLVFVVEKTVEDQAGVSIRYMVETVKL